MTKKLQDYEKQLDAHQAKCDELKLDPHAMAEHGPLVAHVEELIQIMRGMIEAERKRTP
jgi:hypothetical protein